MTPEVITQPFVPPLRGRPPLYRPEYCQAILDYFHAAAIAPERPTPATVTKSSGTKDSWKKTEIRHICAELPTLERFAHSIGHAPQTLSLWASEHPDFGDALARAKGLQKAILIDRGLTRQYDASAFIFVAKNITDMRDETVTTSTSVNVQINVSGALRPADADDAGFTLDVVPKKD